MNAVDVFVLVFCAALVLLGIIGLIRPRNSRSGSGD